jgi:hypothetical protein
LKGTHHLLPYVDDENLLGDNVDTAKKKETFISAVDVIDVAVNADKSKHIVACLVECRRC